MSRRLSTIQVNCQAEGVGCRIENADLENASSGSNVHTQSALYPIRLGSIGGVRAVYEIAPVFVEEDRYYRSGRASWSGYSAPPAALLKELRYLAAQGRADLLILVPPTATRTRRTGCHPPIHCSFLPFLAGAVMER